MMASDRYTVEMIHETRNHEDVVSVASLAPSSSLYAHLRTFFAEDELADATQMRFAGDTALYVLVRGRFVRVTE